MKPVFQIVYKLFLGIASLTGLTYHEINILVYYIVFPAVFIYFIGRRLKRKTFVLWFAIIIGFLLFIIPDFSYFSTYLFNKSVDFLMWFDIIGLNYIQASIVICVFLPLLILLVLVRCKKQIH